MTLDTKTRALVAKINKKYGEDSLVLGADMRVAGRFTTGSLAVDVALGGGFPANQWVEVLGYASAAKTSFVLKAIAANMELDPNFTVFWLAAEHYNADWAEKLGVDNSRMIVYPTQAMEEAYEVMLAFAESRTVDWVVLDSYPALIPDEESQKEMNETVVALGARLTGKFFRKSGAATLRSITHPEDDRRFLGVIINQWRDKIGGFSPMGPQETAPGGKAKDYFYYVRLNLANAGQITENRSQQEGEALKVKVGQTIKFVTKKNKSAPPQQVASVDFYYRDAVTKGFSAGDYDLAKEAITMGIVFKVIVRAGATYKFRDTTWRGKDAMITGVRESPEIQQQIRADVLAVSMRPDNDGLLTEKDISEAENSGEKKVERRANGN